MSVSCSSAGCTDAAQSYIGSSSSSRLKHDCIHYRFCGSVHDDVPTIYVTCTALYIVLCDDLHIAQTIDNFHKVLEVVRSQGSTRKLSCSSGGATDTW